MSQIHLGNHKTLGLIAWFAIALAVSAFIFAYYDHRIHNQQGAIAHEMCLNDEKVATNQEAMIKAILSFLDQQKIVNGGFSPSSVDQFKLDLQYALFNVPSYDCGK